MKFKTIEGFSRYEISSVGGVRNIETQKIVKSFDNGIGYMSVGIYDDIGEMYGVSDSAIRKWCKTYELPYRKKDLELLKRK